MTDQSLKLLREHGPEILNAIRIGMTIELAAKSVGISRNIVHDWNTAGRNERERVESGLAPKPDAAAHLEWICDFEKAQVAPVQQFLRQVCDAADLRWLSWMMERRFGRTFVAPSNQLKIGEAEAETERLDNLSKRTAELMADAPQKIAK